MKIAAMLNMQAQYTHVSAVGFTSIGSSPVCDVTDVQRSLSNTLTSKPGSPREFIMFLLATTTTQATLWHVSQNYHRRVVNHAVGNKTNVARFGNVFGFLELLIQRQIEVLNKQKDFPTLQTLCSNKKKKLLK